MAPARARTSPNARDVIVAVVVSFGGPFLVSVALHAFDVRLNIGARAIVGDAIPALAAAFLLTRWGWWRRVGFKAPIWRSLWLLWLPGLLLVFAIAQGVSYVRRASLPAVVGAVIAALLVGFTEETWFRGILLEGLRGRSARVAAFGSALAFGALHLANVRVLPLSSVVTQSLGALAIGLMFGAARVRIDSLVPLVVIHAAFDVPYLTGSGPRPGRITSDRAGFLGVLILIAVVYALVLTRRSKTGSKSVSEVVPTLG